ncbi:MAG: radical SAM protein [Candidatus Aenigmatarchaeota archaeon]
MKIGTQTDYLLLSRTLKKDEKILDSTLSVCSSCFKIIPALIVENDKKVFLKKECCEKENVLLENDVEYYKKAVFPFVIERNFLTLGENRFSEKILQKLYDEASFIMINVTSRCNLNCPICCAELAPNYFPRRDYPLEDILKFIAKQKSKMILISGGEPTVRKDLPKIIEAIVKSGNVPLLYTNGLMLTDRRYVRKLKRSGLRLVCLSFDGFDDFVYQTLRGRKLLKQKLLALKNLKKEKMLVYLLCAVARGLNEFQVKLIVEFAKRNSDFIRGVRFSPLYPKEGENERATPSDVIKTIKFYFPMVSEEDFIESRRFFYNLYRTTRKLSKKLGKNFSYLLQESMYIYLKVKNNKIEPVFSSTYLKKVNRVLESFIMEKSKIRSFFILLKILPYLLSKDLLRLSMVSLKNLFVMPRASIFTPKDIFILKVGDLIFTKLEDTRRKFFGEGALLFLEPYQ